MSTPIAIRAPLVGREAELAELDEALARALGTGRPQAITIIGGAGVGKTRLLDEFLAKVRARERRVRTFRGAARESGPAYGVVQRILRARFGIVEGADPDVQREAVRAAVTEILGDKRVTEFLHFLGAFLDLTWPESPFTKAFEDDPEQFARIGRAVLRRFVEVDAAVSPLVLVFEDLHLSNDDSLELVRTLLESMHDAPVLMIVSARPELLTRRPEWAESHTKLELAPLKPDDAAQMMLHLLEPTGDPPEELVDAAVDMAGGNPYLLEQMLRTYVASGTLIPRAGGRWDVDLDRLDDAQLPLSVDDAIAARIASLTPAERALLEMAAVMGGVFWLGALVALGRLGKKAPELWGGAEDLGAHYRDLLAGLAERDYVLALPDSSIGSEPEELAFKHNLERETLYRLTSASQLRRYHREFAEWLELRLFEGAQADRVEEHCEMLATHYERGGAPRKAAEYFLAAGDRARARYANAKAADYYARGLELLGEEDVVGRLEAYHHQGDVLQLAGRNEEAIASFRKMLEIAWRLDFKSKGGAAHNRIGRVYRAIGQLEEAMRHLGTGHALFDAANDSRGVASSLDDVGKVHWMRGAYEPAERFMRRSLEIRRELGDARSIALSLNNLGLVYQDSGRFEEAQEAFQEALLIRREIGDLPGMSQTLNNIATIHQDNGDHARANELWREALEYATSVGDRMRQAVILTNLGENAYRQEQPEDAIAVLQKAEAISSTLGDRILEAEILRGLAKAHMLVHDITTARDFIARSVALFEKTRSKPFLGVALRTAGEIAAAGSFGGGEHQRAKHAFEQSVRIFEELGNEVELARSCEAFAAFLESDPDAKNDPVRAHEARRLRTRAVEIQERLAASGSDDALPPLEGEETSPGTVLAG
ncbi:ATP-binding protein [Sandaracinus amylolyticus]|uniref:Adenylate cyclase n=1 Tax=Sandaracinus amylolyticus TaxID=927083 RepID=A0A0F6W442_9BACT|nr:tetratricopeptide repeat protein [Sandaracinus amylolyticus]AKF06917.1 Adenylate cyclase [Sandaracinus amylolyticus]